MARGTRLLFIALVVVVSGVADDGTGQAVTDGEDHTTSSAEPGQGPQLTEGECPPPIPDAETIRCGTVEVPLRRGQVESPGIDIAVAVLSAPEPGRHDDPVVVIDRFEPSLAAFDGFAGLPDAVERDVVIFDMRGLGGSRPSLMCPEVDYLLQPADTDPAMRRQYLDALEDCRKRLEGEGVDLTAYTVGAIADDLVDIRRALGYDTWNVLGYGPLQSDPGSVSSELVYELMRRDGDAIRSVTIEAPTAPQQDPWSIQVENLARVLAETADACTEQPACAAVHPTVRDDLAAGFEQARTEHPAVSGEGDPMIVALDPASIGFYSALALGDSGYLPSFLALGSGTTEELVEVIGATTRTAAPDNVFVHGLLLSTTCPQTGADTTPADRSTPNEFGAVAWGVLVERDSCQLWAFADPDPALDEPVVSDIPTLLLVGQFDPTSTPAGARLVASTLSNGYVYEVPAATSNPLGHSLCAREIRNAFVRDPGREPDTSCLTTVPPLELTP